MIVPDVWDECYANVYHRFAERTVYGDRKTKKIGEAKVILKVLSIHFEFTSHKKHDSIFFMYWEVMSWRTFRCEANGRKKMALRCFKDGGVKEFEIECFQPELLDIIEAKLTMYTTKLAAGISALKGAQDEAESQGERPAKRGSPPPSKRPPPRVESKPKKATQRGSPPPSSKRKPPPRGRGPKKAAPLPPPTASTTSKSGAQAQLMHSAGRGSAGLKPKRKPKGSSNSGLVRGKGARRRPSMGTVL